MPRCSSRPSVMSRSMLSTGFRLVTGSWKIMLMSRPRTARTSASGSASRSLSRNSMPAADGRVGDHSGEADDGARGDALAAAALADEPDELSRRHLEADAVHRVDRAFLRREVDGQVGEPQKRVPHSTHAQPVYPTPGEKHGAFWLILLIRPRQAGKHGPGVPGLRDRMSSMAFVSTRAVDLRTAAPFGISRWTHSEFERFVVELRQGDLVGIGEGAPTRGTARIATGTWDC